MWRTIEMENVLVAVIEFRSHKAPYSLYTIRDVALVQVKTCWPEKHSSFRHFIYTLFELDSLRWANAGKVIM